MIVVRALPVARGRRTPFPANPAFSRRKTLVEVTGIMRCSTRSVL